jgi:hypothetical protein
MRIQVLVSLAVVAMTIQFALCLAHAIPPSAQNVSTMSPQQMINFTLMMKMQNMEMLDRYTKDISNHSSQKFLSSGDFRKIFYPTRVAVRSVRDVLNRNGIQVVSSEGITIRASANASSLESFFNTTLVQYSNGNRTFFGTVGNFSVPSSISDFVAGVLGLDNSSKVRRLSEEANPMEFFTGGALTPSEIQNAYGYTQVYASGIDGNGTRIAVIAAFGNPDMISDLALFSSIYGLSNATLNIYYPGGDPAIVCPPSSDLNVCGWAVETSLDVEWAHAIAPGATIDLIISKDDQLPNLLDCVDYVTNNLQDSTISISWGLYEDALPQVFFNYFDAYFQQAALQGISVFAASGDSGYSGPETGMTSAVFPASSAYVTAVGGTTLFLNPNKSYGFETAWIHSGGGVSSIFAKPQWQFGSNIPSDGWRDIPDVAFDASPNSGVHVIIGGDDNGLLNGGTSLSAAIWAGTSSLINQKIGGNIGLLNPFIYQIGRSQNYANDFHDILSGSNGDYSSGAGFDMVTGWGTPKANNLIGDVASIYYAAATQISFSNFSQNPENASYGERNYTFSASVSDNYGIIESVFLTIDNSSYQALSNNESYSVSIGPLPAGTHDFFWNASDSNVVTAQSNIMQYNITRAIPSITLELNNKTGNITSFLGQDIMIDASINSDALASEFGLYIDGAIVGSNSTKIVFSSHLSTGIHQIEASFFGSQNFTAASNSSFAEIVPILEMNFPNNASYLHGSEVYVNFTVHGMLNVYNITYFLNGNQSGYFEVANGTFNLIDVGQVDSGAYNLTLMMFSGLLNDSAELNFTILVFDTSPPSILNSTVDSENPIVGSNVTVFAVVTDDISGVGNVSMTVCNPSWNTIYLGNMVQNGSEWRATFSIDSPGLYYINITAADLSGNLSNKWVLNLTFVNSSPPPVPPVQPQSVPAYSPSVSIPVQEVNRSSANASNMTSSASDRILQIEDSGPFYQPNTSNMTEAPREEIVTNQGENHGTPTGLIALIPSVGILAAVVAVAAVVVIVVYLFKSSKRKFQS